MTERLKTLCTHGFDVCNQCVHLPIVTSLYAGLVDEKSFVIFPNSVMLSSVRQYVNVSVVLKIIQLCYYYQRGLLLLTVSN